MDVQGKETRRKTHEQKAQGQNLLNREVQREVTRCLEFEFNKAKTPIMISQDIGWHMMDMTL
jgi:hypothetical protein